MKDENYNELMDDNDKLKEFFECGIYDEEGNLTEPYRYYEICPKCGVKLYLRKEED